MRPTPETRGSGTCPASVLNSARRAFSDAASGSYVGNAPSACILTHDRHPHSQSWRGGSLSLGKVVIDLWLPQRLNDVLGTYRAAVIGAICAGYFMPNSPLDRLFACLAEPTIKTEG